MKPIRYAQGLRDQKRNGETMRKELLAAVGAVALVAAMPTAATSATPTGQRVSGNTVLEPVYNAENAGEIGYIMQPEQAPQPLPANPRAWAPFYLVVYPVTSTVATTATLLCQHLPVENCPTHGNNIANLALAREPRAACAASSGGRRHLASSYR